MVRVFEIIGKNTAYLPQGFVRLSLTRLVSFFGDEDEVRGDEGIGMIGAEEFIDNATGELD